VPYPRDNWIREKGDASTEVSHHYISRKQSGRGHIEFMIGLQVGKAAEAERYVQKARPAHSKVLRFLPLVNMLAGFQNGLRRRRLKKLAEVADRL